MKHGSFLKCLAFGVALSAAPLAASAVTLTSETAFDAPGFVYPDLSDATTLPTGAFWDGGVTIATGNQSGIYRTPWDETSNQAVENTDLDNATAAATDYFASGPSNLPNPAKLSFGGLDQTSLTFLWGSPDDYNSLVFRLDGVEVGSFTGTAVTPPASAGSILVTFEGLFDEVWFGSDPNNAFEFASITTTPVPLPAGAVLFLTGLGGFAVMRRRKN